MRAKRLTLQQRRDIFSTLVTIGLTVWNARTANQLRAIELQHQTQQLALEEARDRIARYQFVNSLSSGIFTEDENQRLLAINLVQLTLTPVEAKVFFNGFRSSNDPEVQEFGRIGIASVELQALASRVQLIDAPSSGTRRATMATLVRESSNDPVTIGLVLDLLEEERIDRLSESGRINALYFLNATALASWTPELRARAATAVARIEARHERGVGNVGPQTRGELDKLKARLSQND